MSQEGRVVPVAELWTDKVGGTEKGCENPLGYYDNAPEKWTGSLQLEESHQMHALIFGFFLLKENKIIHCCFSPNLFCNSK
jgi:hypothetical protein